MFGSVLKKRTMKLLNYKILPAICFGLLLFIFGTNTVLASSPHVIIRVQDEQGVPVPGAKVRWTDGEGSYMYQETTGGSYKIRDELNKEVTINTGEALFRSWDQPASNGGFPDRSNSGPDYDHDFISSTGKIPQWLLSSSAASEGRFGCGQNSHTFAATAPPDQQLTCNSIVRDLENAPTTNTFTITCTKLHCPANVRQESCDTANSTVTVAWDAPPGGADGYKVYFDAEPVGVANSLDILHPLQSNQLRRTQRITYNERYLLRVKSLKTINGELKESESCLAEVKCIGTPPSPSPSPTCAPDDRNCYPPPSPGTPEIPSANLTGALCPQRPGPFYYDYTLSDIDTKGNAFLDSKLMITFTRNSQTRQILQFLNGSENIPDDKGFSEWNEQGRIPIDSDYFGFYVYTYTEFPNSSFRLDDNTRIGNRSIGELRNFLVQNNLPTQFEFKANMKSRVGVYGELFNSHIPAGKIDLALSQNAVCAGSNTNTCDEISACVQDIVITNPANDTDIITPVKNGNQENITFSWTSTSAAIGTQYEVLLYNTSKFSSAQDAYNNKLSASAADLQYKTTTNQSQVFNIANMAKTLRFAVRARNISCPIAGSGATECGWTEKDVKLGFQVSGNFYLDNQCVNTSQLVNITGQISSGSETVPLTNQSSYQINLPYTNGGSNLTLSIGGEDYVCATESLQCPTALNSTTCQIAGITGPGTKHFYVQTTLSQFKSWWQVRGGLVYGNNSITSKLPFDKDGNTPCTEPDCKPFLVRREYLANTEKSAGIPMTTGSFSSDINGWWTDRASNNRAHASNASNILTGDKKEDYDFFIKLLSGDVTPQDSPGTITNLTGGTTVGDAQVTIYNGDLTVRANSTINASGKRVILVKGNIRFESTGPEKVIDVDNGEFLAFIATGNIVFDNEIGADVAIVNDINPNVEGIFIADNEIIIEGNSGGNDKKFIGAGSFIGWRDVKLNRHFHNTADDTDATNQIKNTNMPVESFFFRPDFAVNTPEFMRNSTFTWKEVN